jgi:hypothetical protein
MKVLVSRHPHSNLFSGFIPETLSCELKEEE